MNDHNRIFNILFYVHLLDVVVLIGAAWWAPPLLTVCVMIWTCMVMGALFSTCLHLEILQRAERAREATTFRIVLTRGDPVKPALQSHPDDDLFDR